MGNFVKAVFLALKRTYTYLTPLDWKLTYRLSPYQSTRTPAEQAKKDAIEAANAQGNAKYNNRRINSIHDTFCANVQHM